MSGVALIVGESVIDVRGDGAHSVRTVGGGPLNIAVAASRLGTPTTLLTDLGDDDDAVLAATHLVESGVTVHATRAGSTSVASYRIAADGSAEYEFNIEWRLDPELIIERPTVNVLHVGSLGIFLDPGALAVSALIDAAGDAIVSVDPNIRPGLLSNFEVARARFERVCERADVVKLSDEDASWLFPDRPIDAVLEYLLHAGAELVVITKGASGAILATPTSRRSVRAVAAAVVDTIGAGDTFMGALIHQLCATGVTRRELPSILSAADLTELGAFAAAAASITVSRQGADPPWSDELVAVLHRRLTPFTNPGAT
jgi:fructokinase